MEIFDGHTHFFGRNFYEFRTTRSRDGNPEITIDGEPEITPADIVACRTRVLTGMDACGVSKAATYAFIAQETESVGKAALGSGGRLVPYAAVDPLAPASLARLERLQTTYRFRGMLLFPAMHEYSIDGDDAARALDLAQAHGMIVLVHCGPLQPYVRTLFGLDPDTASDHGRIADLAAVAHRRPHQTFVVVHLGPSRLEEFWELGTSCPNTYADTGAITALTAERGSMLDVSDVFRETKRAYGADRILYGSDSSGFDRHYRKHILDAQTGALVRAGFTADDRAAVLGGNLSRLLDLPLRCAP
jgi:predicted TIM-barrel fold metal-dependent hydrolase